MSEFTKREKHQLIYVMLDQEAKGKPVTVIQPYWELPEDPNGDLLNHDHTYIPAEHVRNIRIAMETGFITSVQDIKAYLAAKKKDDE